MRVDNWHALAENNAIEWNNGSCVTYGELSVAIEQRKHQLSQMEELFFIIPMGRKLETIIDLFAVIGLNKIFIPVEENVSEQKLRQLAQHFPAIVVLTDNDICFHGKAAYTKLPNDTLFIAFTSGTTGEEKGFIRNHASWVASFARFRTVKQFAGERVACLSPLNYTLGLYTLLETFYLGKTFLLEAVSFPELLEQQKSPLEICGVPSIFRLAFQKKAFYSDQQFLFNLGGESFDPYLNEQFQKNYPNSSVLTYYGASETSFIAYQFRSGAMDKEAILFPDVDVHIKNPDENGIGEINITSPMTFSGYYEYGKINTATELVSTGDLGYLDRSLVYLGRKDDQINRGGEKVFAQQVKEQLMGHPEVKDVRVSKKEDRVFGEKILVDVVWKETAQSLEELNKYLQEKTIRKIRIDELYNVEAIELSHSGKAKRRER